MKNTHFLLLVLFLPLTGCGLFADPTPPLAYFTYGNATDKTITVKTFANDHITMNSAFTIAPGEEYTYPVREYGSGAFDGRSPYVSVSNGEYLFVQDYGVDYFSKYLFYYYYSYQEARSKDKIIYYKYVFSDKDFDASSGNNFLEVPN